MSLSSKEKINNQESGIENPKVFITLIILLLVILFFTSNDQKSGFNREEFIFGSTIIIASAVLIYIFAFKRNLHFSKIEKDILIISMDFLSITGNSEKDMHSKLHALFSAYNKKELFKLIKKYYFEKPPIIKSCEKLSFQIPEVKYYALYSLMDLASTDSLYSLKEEEFIDKVRNFINVSEEDFQSVKNVYLKKGLREERDILEEQERKKGEVILPYMAFKILGVTPGITVDKLNRVYKTKSKQYLPEKFIGKRKEHINEAKEKYDELALAYKNILKYIKSK